MALAETARLAVRIDLEGNANAGITNLQRKVNGLGTSLSRTGRGVGQLAGGFARAGLVVGGAAVAGLTGAAKAAIDFEDAFAGVRKTVDEADLRAAGTSFEELERTFRDMATTIPIAATEFARLGETAGALGVKANDIDEFVRTTALLGVTTDLTADQAADSLGRIGTILQFTGKDYENFADSLVALGNAGASTESEIIEISKRFAAEGKAAGLATDDIAGLASATASLGFAPERGGTALSRVFANMATNISLANGKGKTFAKVTGRSITNLQKALDKGEGLGIFLDVLKSIKGLSPTDAAKTLKALGVTNNSDRTIFRAMADNLPFVTDQLEIAANATGALSEEATKRFDTVRSKIQLLKNGVIEAGITIGEGFAPAVGRAAEKLSAFLKQDGNKSELKKLGEDIGKAIDDIDWNEVLRAAKDFVGVMKSALSVTMRIVSAVSALPTEIKGAVAGLLVLNKASGGLVGAGIGNIVGGLAGAAGVGLASKAPGIGKLFAQPVFVTNFPPGFGTPGGPGSPAGGPPGRPGRPAPGRPGGRPGRLAGGGGGAAIAVGLDQIANANNKLLGKVEQVRSEARGGVSTLNGTISGMLDRTKDDTVNATTKVQQRVAESRRETQRGLEQVKATARSGLAETKRETARGTSIVSATQRSGTGQVVGAIRANRPIVTTIVNVSATHVSRTVNVTKRYGNTDSRSSGYSSGAGQFGQ